MNGMLNININIDYVVVINFIFESLNKKKNNIMQSILKLLN